MGLQSSLIFIQKKTPSLLNKKEEKKNFFKISRREKRNFENPAPLLNPPLVQRQACGEERGLQRVDAEDAQHGVEGVGTERREGGGGADAEDGHVGHGGDGDADAGVAEGASHLFRDAAPAAMPGLRGVAFAADFKVLFSIGVVVGLRIKMIST